MKNNDKKINLLIKRKNLITKFKKFGINRVNKEAIILFERNIEEGLDKLIMGLKEEISINGRKTLLKEDIKKIFSKEKELGFEI